MNVVDCPQLHSERRRQYALPFINENTSYWRNAYAFIKSFATVTIVNDIAAFMRIAEPFLSTSGRVHTTPPIRTITQHHQSKRYKFAQARDPSDMTTILASETMINYPCIVPVTKMAHTCCCSYLSWPWAACGAISGICRHRFCLDDRYHETPNPSMIYMGDLD